MRDAAERSRTVPSRATRRAATQGHAYRPLTHIRERLRAALRYYLLADSLRIRYRLLTTNTTLTLTQFPSYSYSPLSSLSAFHARCVSANLQLNVQRIPIRVTGPPTRSHIFGLAPSFKGHFLFRWANRRRIDPPLGPRLVDVWEAQGRCWSRSFLLCLSFYHNLSNSSTGSL